MLPWSFSIDQEPATALRRERKVARDELMSLGLERADALDYFSEQLCMLEMHCDIGCAN